LIVDTIVFDGVSVRNDDRSRAWLASLRQDLEAQGLPLRDVDVLYGVIGKQYASVTETAELPPVLTPVNALLAVRGTCIESLGHPGRTA
jgi:hypothetical protein